MMLCDFCPSANPKYKFCAYADCPDVSMEGLCISEELWEELWQIACED